MVRLPFLLLTMTLLLFSCGSDTESSRQQMLSDSSKATPTTDKSVPPSKDQTLVAAPDTIPAPSPVTTNSPKEQKKKHPLEGKHVFGVQFIWDHYGSATITQEGDSLHIAGEQLSKDQAEYCRLNGTITLINEKKFVVDGKIELFTKDCCGKIARFGKFTFLKSGKRKFWRLQNFDHLCDQYTCAYYMDIFE